MHFLLLWRVYVMMILSKFYWRLRRAFTIMIFTQLFSRLRRIYITVVIKLDYPPRPLELWESGEGGRWESLN